MLSVIGYIVGLVISLVIAVYASRDDNGEVEKDSASFYGILAIVWPFAVAGGVFIGVAVAIVKSLEWLIVTINQFIPNKAKQSDE